MKIIQRLVLVGSMSVALTACTGTRPTDIGVVDGRLTPCPSSPNCVGSFEAADDKHYIKPLTMANSAAAARTALLDVIQATENAAIVSTTDNYVYAEYTSRLMRYVDDVEFLLDGSADVIHVRSASRLGYSDLNANRKRVEAIREALAAKLSAE